MSLKDFQGSGEAPLVDKVKWTWRKSNIKLPHHWALFLEIFTGFIDFQVIVYDLNACWKFRPLELHE